MSKTRLATENDLFDLCKMAEVFVAEGKYPLTFCFGATLRTFQGYMAEEAADIIVVEDDEGNIAGGALVFADTQFHFEPFGYIGKFYIHPDYRKTTLGFRLISGCNQWFKERNVVEIFVTATAGLEDRQTKAFQKIMERAGFEADTPILIKRLHNGKNSEDTRNLVAENSGDRSPA